MARYRDGLPEKEAGGIDDVQPNSGYVIASYAVKCQGHMPEDNVLTMFEPHNSLFYITLMTVRLVMSTNN